MSPSHQPWPEHATAAILPRHKSMELLGQLGCWTKRNRRCLVMGVAAQWGRWRIIRRAERVAAHMVHDTPGAAHQAHHVRFRYGTSLNTSWLWPRCEKHHVMLACILCLTLLTLAATWFLWRGVAIRWKYWETRDVIDEKHGPEENAYNTIEPLTDFEWSTTPPIHNAPLKSKYHLTMALENATLSDTVAMDNTYADRMETRRTIMQDNRNAVLQCTPACESAVMELYDWMFGIYLPMRFPKVYRPSDCGLLNTVSNETVPWHATSATHALETLGGHVDTDFILLLPSSAAPDSSPIYCLEAFVVCFPSGFSLQEKLGMPLAGIHSPVPGYKAKLEKSMDRFFAKLECGRAVKRSNWAVTTDDRLFVEAGNHLYEGDEDAGVEQQKQHVVAENCRLRSERQTLFRLPKTGALVFSFKTYQYTLQEVKQEGYAEELAQAIEGLATGNVPQMQYYKRGVVWGDAVVEYLRS